MLSSIAIGVVAYGIFGSACAAQAKTTKIESVGAAVFKQASPSVLLVKGKSRDGSMQGSGVSFRNGFNKIGGTPVSSWIVTNAHVVAGSTSVTVATEGATYPADVKYIDESLDLALLLVPDAVIAPAKIMSASKVAIGDRVFAIGSPMGLANSISEGILSGLRTYQGANVVQTTAPISSGNSGGGLFDSKGRLIGITTFKLKSGESLNFAIDSSYVNVLMDANTSTNLILSFMDMYEGLDEWKSNPSKLTRWFIATKSDDGRPMYEYFEQKLFESFKAGGDSIKALMAEIKDRYLRKPLNNFSGAASTVSPKQSESNQVAYRLSCPMFATDSGEFFRDLNFNVSVAESKVNNLPATFTSDEIIFSLVENGKFQVRLNRYTGVASYGNPEYPGFFRGKCVKVEGRQF